MIKGGNQVGVVSQERAAAAASCQPKKSKHVFNWKCARSRLEMQSQTSGSRLDKTQREIWPGATGRNVLERQIPSMTFPSVRIFSNANVE